MLPGDLIVSRAFGFGGVQSLFKTPLMAIEPDGRCGVLHSNELCLIVSVHVDRLLVLTAGFQMGWKHSDDFHAVQCSTIMC